MCLGLCNAGASTLHNSLGGAGCGGKNCNDMVSTVPAWTGTANENACQGKMLNDPCMPSMGALAPPLPEGAARLTVHLIARAQSFQTSSAVMIPTHFRGLSTSLSRTPRATPTRCATVTAAVTLALAYGLPSSRHLQEAHRLFPPPASRGPLVSPPPAQRLHSALSR